LWLTTRYSIITHATALFHAQNDMADSTADSIPVFLNQGSAEHRYEFREKSWNK